MSSTRPQAEPAPRPGLVICGADPEGADALALVREAALEARALYPELHAAGSPWPTNPPTLPRGLYLVAYRNGTALACGALRPIDEHAVEVRRMFVRRDARRAGLAKAILVALERAAADLGFSILRLETGCRQQPAMALYESCGFRRIAPFGAYVGDPTSVCYEKAVASPNRA